MKMFSLNARAAVVSLLLLVCFLGIWELSTSGPSVGGSSAGMSAEEIEYLQMMGKDPGTEKSAGVPGPWAVAQASWGHLSDPFYDKGPNDKGIGIQLGHSLARVAAGYLLAMVVAIPLGFLIGMSPLMRKALDPFVQVLKPISPLAWMPLALYALKDSDVSGIFVIFICSIWPMLINTAFGVAAVKREWLNVASTLEVNPLRKAFQVILPAAAPTILTGMRISMGIAWLVIVAAEMLVGGTGIGYFVWNEWNNLSLTNVIFAVLLIGVVGMLLDLMFAQLQKVVTYVE
ncbi:MAG: nitrate ABC transporter permease [Hydrogenophaga sp.]|jgi:nitrate/nitrite transport system permease protein|uniref:nitrate ABC transporter permease n=1 Tax=Hydrogenophaga sp. TaxID=1904254 RepID=UPI00271AAAEA|nr:nitrate ABC transporter permease [Hydrogenophaga sp.]MDO9570996.1 nitrate ABC transporter permease [Hydrogenophaga sp.]MDP3343797.1 nitrate ABC transporter permease [Hydrogenophaga sp.]MDP3375386.1 nitrate ABC transporter permease [Hydrogenophaga sp.]MDP3808512.1 nitrate ABC transporter permease [Hydrogenophaga sp.]MDZ4237922.1 nitrate ABC transporter permease [Hydrogenophaga sp.]